MFFYSQCVIQINEIFATERVTVTSMVSELLRYVINAHEL